jgi:hypothetical protein
VRVPEDSGFLQGFNDASVTPDLLKDGLGDATIGTCGNSISGRNGTDGFDSHVYVYSGRDLDRVFDTPRTENGDSIPRPIPQTDNLITNQLVGGRIYGISSVNFRARNSFESGNRGFSYPQLQHHFLAADGAYHIPDSILLSGGFTKTYEFRFGLDRAGPDSLFDRVPSDRADFRNDDYFDGKLGTEFQKIATITATFINGSNGHYDSGQGYHGTVHFRYIGALPANRVVANGDDITERDFVGVALNDRRVFMTKADYSNNGAHTVYDTGLTFGQVLDGGIFFRVTVLQDSTSLSPLKFDINYSIPQSGFELNEVSYRRFHRCNEGRVYIHMNSSHHRTRDIVPDYDGVFIKPPGWPAGFNYWYDVCNHDPAWWVNDRNAGETKDNLKLIAALGWIQNLKVSNGTFSDSAFLIVPRFFHKDSAGAIKQAVYASDYDDVTIPDGTEIPIGEVEAGDTFELGLDNPGEATAEVTGITFDTPFISTVDDSTPTLSPYELQTVVFTTSTATTGSSDIVVAHDQNGSQIPSPWTLTLTVVETPGGGGPPE